MKFKEISRPTLVILATLIVFRISVPEVIKVAINQKLDEVEGIDGHVTDIDLSLFRGAYQIQGLELFLQQGQGQVPTIAAEELDISILWSALFRGEIVAEVKVDSATLVFIDDVVQEDQIKEQAKRSDTWLTLIDFASPVSVDQVDVSNSKLVLINRLGGQQQKNYIENIQGHVTNITNSREFTGDRIANFFFTGDVMGQANATFKGFLNPDTVLPTFDVSFSMQRLPVSYLGDLIDFYTPIDVEAGKVDAAAEIIALNGEVKGYIKAGIYHPNIFNWKNDIRKDKDGLVNGIFEALIDGFANIFQSGKHDLVAVNVPIKGTVNNTQISMWDAFKSMLHHAFINEYKIIVDDSIGLNEQHGGLSKAKGSENESTRN